MIRVGRSFRVASPGQRGIVGEIRIDARATGNAVELKTGQALSPICRGGRTQIRKVLAHVRREAEKRPVAALAYAKTPRQDVEAGPRTAPAECRAPRTPGETRSRSR